MSSVVVLCLMLAVSGQEPAKVATVPQATDATEDYQVGPGDLLSIRVSGVREFDQSTRISNSGRIRVPYVGVIFVAGMTTLQIERDVARLIKEHELVSEPSVRVQVDEHRARPTYVVGEVSAPGQFVITSEMYLLDLISKAGGLLAGADDTGFLYRRTWPRLSIDARVVGEGPTPVAPAAAASTPEALPTNVQAVESSKAEEVIRINFEELRKGIRPELNVRLQGGDVLLVPRRRPQNIYVIGDVTVPGAYTLPRRGQITAAQAVIYAGGPMPTASMKRAFLMRHDANGVRQAMPVNFKAIIAGEQPDIPVKADDIIYIPNSTAKTIGVGLLNLIPTLVQQWLIF